MVLVLALHKIEVENAMVPLSMIVLTDYIKRRSLPPDLKCRMVLPSGSVSISLWDTSSLVSLQEWLDITLAASEPGLVSTCHEVQEDFSYGIAFDLAQKRATDKMAASSRSALSSISKSASVASGNMWKQLEAFDKRTHLLTATEEAFVNIRTKTVQAVDKEKVAVAMTSISDSIASANSALSWFGSKVKESLTAGGSLTQQHNIINGDATSYKSYQVQTAIPEGHGPSNSVSRNIPLAAVVEENGDGLMSGQGADGDSHRDQGSEDRLLSSSSGSRTELKDPKLPASTLASDLLQPSFILSEDLQEIPTGGAGFRLETDGPSVQ
ncbi:hypothetical protein CEUSTIGMA_g3582.t1 [Chlamydomonas eustigma]|uniref:Uncharacterized protein n=1 Tax=Chlamydomonas eustigma TaxID=1157962 RepID=A0A250WZL7_9CHLO|nr:hypothetical protein CEUSTIGMA_g3582.t1 [Chlamydomonas eustigma]|eukprot:GAX76139.1 hypothetical protein CEUSTIGMA_g3582.t1 [Chlamydomonas eustigma]